MPRKKILFCNEFSLLSTGYAVYGKEVISRLYGVDRFEIAEFALYVSPTDPRIRQVPWKVYANAPEQNQEEIAQQYAANPLWQFGAWRFEEVVLDFKPDVVISIMDPWMFEHMANSPLRRHFNLILMPTVDSSPQQTPWLNMFINADRILTYCDYGTNVLKEEAQDLINLVGSASPAASKKTYSPVLDREEHKSSLGLRKGIKFIGTVMRNQKRKLYPDLLEAYQLFLDKCEASGQHALARDTLMYWHITFPDIGWDVPDIIKKSGLGHRIMMTYACRNPQCRNIFVSFFSGPRIYCPNCGQFEAGMPTTQNGVPEEALNKIMNLFDVYVQYAIAEGAGMPQMESALCGVPVMAVDWSAMSDIVRKVSGFPIRVEKKFLEAETRAYRVYPDNQHLADELFRFLNLPEPIRKKHNQETFKACDAAFSYDRSTKRWEDVIDSLDARSNWETPSRAFMPNQQPPQNLTNAQFAKWAIVHVLGEPDKLGGYLHLKLVKDLNYGAYIPGFGGSYLSEDSTIGSKPVWAIFNRQHAIEMLGAMRQQINYWEGRRLGMIPKPDVDFLKNAKPDVRDAA